MPPLNKPGRGKQRIRKRKRRQASSSSSSSSSESESDAPTAQQATASLTAIPTAPAEEDSSEQSSLSDSNSVSSASDAESVVRDDGGGNARLKSPHRTGTGPQSRSPSPPSPTIPSLVTLKPTTDEEKQRDAQLREKFRKFWMASVADAFKDDLEKIQKV
jgi:ribosome assembly protein 3